MTNTILLPPAILVAWTLVMVLWMAATRLPAMQKAKMHPEKAKHISGETWTALPSSVRQVADNYNHLTEQPTIFYAITLILAVSGEAGALEINLAWGYVGLRILHSLWQATRNVVTVRFYLFLASTLVLFPLTGRAIYLLAT